MKAEKEINDLVQEWLACEDTIRRAKGIIEDIKDELINISTKMDYTYSKTVRVYATMAKKVTIDKIGVLDYYKPEKEFEALLSSTCFKVGAIRKNANVKHFLKTEVTDEIKMEKINPEFLPDVKNSTSKPGDNQPEQFHKQTG